MIGTVAGDRNLMHGFDVHGNCGCIAGEACDTIHSEDLEGCVGMRPGHFLPAWSKSQLSGKGAIQRSAVSAWRFDGQGDRQRSVNGGAIHEIERPVGGEGCQAKARKCDRRSRSVVAGTGRVVISIQDHESKANKLVYRNRTEVELRCIVMRAYFTIFLYHVRGILDDGRAVRDPSCIILSYFFGRKDTIVQCPEVDVATERF